MTITSPTIVLTVGASSLTFTGSEIISANLVEEINPLSVELPFNVLEFTILSYNTSFSMFSGNIYNLLSERLPIMAYENVNGVSTFLGKFYLDKWTNLTEYKFQFRAIDVIGTMAATDYEGGFWSIPTTLETVLNQVLLPKNIVFTIDDTLKSIPIQGWIPPGDYRSALQQICFAAGVVASCARSDRLMISPIIFPFVKYDYKLTKADKLKDEPIELTPLVTSIELVSHSFTQGTDIQTIFDKYLEVGSHKIIFDQPYYSIVIDGPGYVPLLFINENGDFIVTENSDYIEAGGQYTFGPNSINLEMQEAGQVTITGYPWVDSKRSYLFYETGLTEYANKNALTISDATMINETNAQAILDQIRDYYRQRYKQTITTISSEIQTNDIVLSSTIFNRKILTTVLKMDMDLTGGNLQTNEILGIEPIYVEPIEFVSRKAITGIALPGMDLTYNNRWRTQTTQTLVRYARTGVAICGEELMFNNQWRIYG